MADNELIINNSVFNNRIYAKELRIDTTSGKIYKVNDDETREEIELDESFAELVEQSKPIHIAVLTAVTNASTPSADKLTTGRNINLTGAATGTTVSAFDGSADATINVTSLSAAYLVGELPSTLPIPGSSVTGTVANATNAANATKLATARNISLTGSDVTGTATTFDGSSDISIPTTLSNTGVTSGTYGSGLDTTTNKIKVPQIEIDSKGRIKSANNIDVSITPVSSFEWANITNKPTTISGFGITDAKIENNTITLGSNTLSVASLPIDISSSSNVTGVLNVTNGGTGVKTLDSLKNALGLSNAISMQQGFLKLSPNDSTSPTVWNVSSYSGCITGSSTVFNGSQLLSITLNPTINSKHPSFITGSIFGTYQQNLVMFLSKSISCTVISTSVASDAEYGYVTSYISSSAGNGTFGGSYLIKNGSVYTLNIYLDSILKNYRYDSLYAIDVTIYVQVFYA